jgi:probable HAF family extracellular repeat protein
MLRRTMFVLGLIALVGIMPALRATAAVPSPYTIADIGSASGTNGTSQARGINAAGDVVGQSSTLLGVSHAVLYKAGVLLDLGALGADPSAADSVSASDTTVGYDLPAGSIHAVQFSNEMVNDLTPAAAVAAQATSVNDAGTIVGGDVLAGGLEQALEFTGSGGSINLGVLPGGPQFALATQINNAGQVVGFAKDGSGVIQAVTFTGGVAKVLPALAGAQDNVAVDGSGTGGYIVGYSVDGSGADHAMEFGPGTSATDLGDLAGGGGAEALGVNASGQAVGFSLGAAGSTAALFSGGTATDLNSLLPSGSGWTLQVANGINDAGQIVGYGVHNGLQRGFVMTPPAPPPPPSCGQLSALLNTIPYIGPPLAALVCQLGVLLHIPL